MDLSYKIQNCGLILVTLALLDSFQRPVTYLRLSVTDRCDFRCVYCMSPHMRFLPRQDVLTLPELIRLCQVFLTLGIRKIRITGGEPLIRRNILELFQALHSFQESGLLEEITLTTNGSRLHTLAPSLAKWGVRRINVSLDSLKPDRFRAITTYGQLDTVLQGIETAQKLGLKLKLNVVALKGVNEDEWEDLVAWAHSHQMDLSFIEVMPMGETEEERFDQYIPLTQVRQRLASIYTLTESSYKTPGPSRYYEVAETGRRIGFITPLTHNFCETCNRIRLTCTGTLYPCLGQENSADLRTPLRQSSSNTLLYKTIMEAIDRKPKGHNFMIQRHFSSPVLKRSMNVTGG